MTNLLHETERCISNSGHVPEDIVYIGSQYTGHRCTWEQFQTLANKSYVRQGKDPKVLDDLVVVFSDGTMMWRAKADNDEYWEYSPSFTEPNATHQIESLFCEDYEGNPVNFGQIVRENL